jgi:hypothetical protein
MNLKKQLTAVAALAVSALAIAGTATAQDAHERSAAVSVQTAIAYFDANERATLAKSPGVHAIEYFRANERATIGQSGGNRLTAYIDGAQRSEPLVGPSDKTVVTGEGAGFDWSSAAVGASSALMLALLIGVSLLTVRRVRTGPYAH